MKTTCVGRWRIVEMEQWDQEFIDLVSPGQVTFEAGRRGHFHFGAVDLDLDWRLGVTPDRAEFTFEGFDEGDEVSGRGWAEVQAGKLKGRIVFHQGEESGFVARNVGKAHD
jgi:hypothetical protein